MATRLVVGCGSIGTALITELREQPGTLLVLDESDRRVERLREDGVSATQIDTVDAETIGSHVDSVDTVVVADDTPDENVRAARAARTAFPDSYLVAFAGAEPTEAAITTLESVADDVIHPGGSTATFLKERVGDDGLEVRQLRQAFWDVTEPLAIVTHDNPDPDAIASAVALQHIADALDVESEVCYYGRISHQENRAFINLLDFELTRLEPGADLSMYGGFALVDHSRPGVNDQLPPETPVDIVIDHHPPRAPVDARFVDLRSNVGATSTLMVQYLQLFGISFEEAVATGLLFGIRVDTNDFTREVSAADFAAAAAVVPAADIPTLERIESPSITGDTFETIANAISNRQARGSVLTSFVGDLSDRDALAQAADRLLDLEGVNATVVYGIIDGVIYISGRARGTELDLGETLRDAFDQIGSAGGHADMAGAQIQVADTALDTDPAEHPNDASDGESEADDASSQSMSTDAAVSVEADELETFIAERFFEALQSRPPRERTGLSPAIDRQYEHGEW